MAGEGKTLYHVTREADVDSILDAALRPGEDVGRQHSSWGMHGDASYVYLWDEQRAAETARRILAETGEDWTPDSHTLLEVNIPAEHPLERDYDQFLFVLDGDPGEDWIDQWRTYVDDSVPGDTWRTQYINTRLKDRGVDAQFTGRPTEENVKQFADSIPDETWQSCIGSYRTGEPIPGDYISHVGFDYLAEE